MKFPADSVSKKVLQKRRWLIHAIMSSGLILVVMSVSSLNVALPTLVRELGASGTDLQWIVDSYALVFAGLLLFAGAVGDRFGRRGAFLGGVTIFMLSTAMAAFANNPDQLILYRSLMGVGAAFVMPATLSIIANTFQDKEERGKAIAMWAGFAGAAGAIGPIVSGILLERFWWGSIFLMPIPVILIAIVATIAIVPTSKDPEAEKLDIFGSILSIAGLATLLYGVIEAPNYGWLTTQTLVPIVSGLAILLGFFLWEKHSAHPMLPMRFFKSKRFSIGSLAVTLTFFAMFGMFFVLVQYQQFVLGYSALGAAVRTLPMPITLIAVASQVTNIEKRLGTRRTIASGLLIAAAGFIVFSFLDPASTYINLLIGFVLIGIGMALAMPPATEAIIGAVPQRKAGVGSAVNDTTREVGGALGIAILGSILASVYRSEMSKNLTGYPTEVAEVAQDSVGAALGVAGLLGDAGQQLAQAASEAFSHGMTVTMYVSAGFITLSAFIVYHFMVDKEKPISDD